MTATYDVFISHSTRLDADTTNEALIALVCARLGSKGLRLFVDRTSLSEGQALTPALAAAIESSRMILFVVTRSAERSSWVEFEREQARRSGIPVRAIVRDGQAPIAGFSPREVIRAPSPFTEEGTAQLVSREVLRLLKWREKR